MKIVIVGYGEMFQALISGVLKTNHEIIGVFRQENIKYPALKRFLHDFICPSPDFNFVRALKLKDINAPGVNSPKFLNEISRLKADLIIAGSWSEKFSIQTINAPKIACINAHPSLLPEFRGPNPYIHVILQDRKESGITFHLMDVNYDTGAVLLQKHVVVTNTDTGGSLKLRCCDAAKKGIIELLNDFQNKINNPVSQNEQAATYQPQISLSESILDFTKETAVEIDRRIRALTPWMKCYIPYKNEFFTFKDYKIFGKPSDKPAATIVKKTRNSVFIVCRDGRVIHFKGLSIKRPLSKFYTALYIKYFMKINSQAI